jgi:hypothetical protein
MKDFDHWSYKTFRAEKHPHPEISQQWIESFDAAAGQLCSKLFAGHSGQKHVQANQVCLWSDVNSAKGLKAARRVMAFAIGHALVPHDDAEQGYAEISKQDFYSALGLSDDNSETKAEFLRSLDGTWRYCSDDFCSLSLSWIVCCNPKAASGQVRVTLETWPSQPTNASQEIKLGLRRGQLFH